MSECKCGGSCRCHRDQRGPLGPRGLPRRCILSIEEFIGYAVTDILTAYKNAYDNPQEPEHAQQDMNQVLDDLKRDYGYLVWSKMMIDEHTPYKEDL